MAKLHYGNCRLHVLKKLKDAGNNESDIVGYALSTLFLNCDYGFSSVLGTAVDCFSNPGAYVTLVLGSIRVWLGIHCCIAAKELL